MSVEYYMMADPRDYLCIKKLSKNDMNNAVKITLTSGKTATIGISGRLIYKITHLYATTRDLDYVAHKTELPKRLILFILKEKRIL